MPTYAVVLLGEELKQDKLWIKRHRGKVINFPKNSSKPILIKAKSKPDALNTAWILFYRAINSAKRQSESQPVARMAESEEI